MTFDEKVFFVLGIFKSIFSEIKIEERTLMNSRKIIFFSNPRYSKKCHQVCVLIKEGPEKDSVKVDYIFWPRERIIKNTNTLIFESKEKIKLKEEEWLKDQAWLALKHMELLKLKKPQIDKKIIRDFSLIQQTLSN